MNDISHLNFYSSRQSPLFKQDSIHFILTHRAQNLQLTTMQKEQRASSFPYDKLNLAYHVGDKYKCVQSNRAVIMEMFYPHKTLFYLNQIHSAKIIHVNSTDTLNPILDKHFSVNPYPEMLLGDGDGIICDSADVVGLIMVADCNPVIVYCPKQHVFALLHAGRMGIELRIVTQSVRELEQKFHVNPRDLKVFVGTSIRDCCYEIGWDIAQWIASHFGEKYLKFDNHIQDAKNALRRKEGKKPRLDMIAMLHDEMLTCGILRENMEIFPVCSCCSTKYFSYRRDGVTGRFGLFASLC